MRHVLLLLGVLIAGCGETPGRVASAPTSSSVASSTTTSSMPTTTALETPSTPTTEAWVLGARPLPLGPDGKPLAQETPPQLRNRRLTAPDRLPPPADGAFHSSIQPIDAAVREQMGSSWQPGCPVPLEQLRYLRVGFRGFDGKAHTGEIVVNAKVTDDVVSVFRALFAADFPIEEMRLPGTADLEAPPIGDGNDTAAFVCRPTRGSSSFSAHAYGLAVDVNPFQNPYQKGDVVLPELARAYTDRTDVRPGMIRRGDVVTKAFAAIGWTWGGSYTSLKDPMHFSQTGK